MHVSVHGQPGLSELLDARATPVLIGELATGVAIRRRPFEDFITSVLPLTATTLICGERVVCSGKPTARANVFGRCNASIDFNEHARDSV